MRQAIEEGFILDVLKNYTPYRLAFKLANGGEEWDEQEVEKSAAMKGIMRWVRLHPYNIAQKVQIVVEHFRENVAPLLSGKAKAMVVLGSRLEAAGTLTPPVPSASPESARSSEGGRGRRALPTTRLHDLRHSAASNLANSGQSLYVIAKVLGHSQTRTTERYAHLSDQTLLSAVNTAANSIGIDWSAKRTAEV